MKLATFTTTEDRVTWYQNEIEAIRNNGLKNAKEAYETALRGEGKESWMRLNNTTDEEMWNRHLGWMREQIEHLERKIRKYQREIAKNR